MPVLKGNKSFYDYEVSDTLAHNLKCWLEYGLLEMGGYTRIKFDLPSSGYTNLKRVIDDEYGGTGRVYEGMGPGWVWEEDVSPIGGLTPPFRASGVHVDNTFYPTATTSGTYAHKIDFRTGKVMFDTGLPTSATVKCEYTLRNVAVHLVDEPQWHTIVQRYTQRYEELSLSPSGMAQVLKADRIWLPAVIVDVRDRTNEGLQLGGGEINNFTVDYHIFSEKPFENRRLADLLNNQYQTTLDLFDVNNINFPYNRDGTLASGAMTYPNLANRNGPYFWEYARIEATDGGPRDSDSDVLRAEITQVVAVDRHLITY